MRKNKTTLNVIENRIDFHEMNETETNEITGGDSVAIRAFEAIRIGVSNFWDAVLKH